MEMSAAQLSELRRPDAIASRPILLIDKVGFSVPSGNGKLVILENLDLAAERPLCFVSSAA
jgi:hypothetical protein